MDRVRIGVLGAARIAPKAVLTPAKTVPEAEVVAIAARDPARAAAFATKHAIPRVHESYETLIADDEIDAIYNPLPNGLHGEWTIAALRAGKHVLCEKPFTANAAEAAEVAAAAERTGKVVMEAFHYRYHPLMARVLEIVGTLGPIRDISTHMIAVLPNKKDVRYQIDLAGGATMDVGCYAIHQMRTVAGSVPERTTGSVPTVTSAVAKLAAPGVDRAMQARFSFADGCTGSMDCALLAARAPIADLKVTGERGTTRVMFPTRPQLGWITTSAGGTTRRERVKGEATFWYQLQAFCGAVLRGEPVLTPPADAVANMRVIDAVYEQAGLGARTPAP
ncbi:MAG: Gfo/Idh/MocA family oxidoreductase [Acidimicrobiia bacterium]